MSKKIGLKVFGATIGIAAAGGIVGFAATNWDGIQKVAQGPVYTEQELAEQVKGNEDVFQKGYDAGLEDGLSQGYTEEDLQEAENRGYENGLAEGTTNNSLQNIERFLIGEQESLLFVSNQNKLVYYNLAKNQRVDLNKYSYDFMQFVNEEEIFNIFCRDENTGFLQLMMIYKAGDYEPNTYTFDDSFTGISIMSQQENKMFIFLENDTSRNLYYIDSKAGIVNKLEIEFESINYATFLIEENIIRFETISNGEIMEYIYNFDSNELQHEKQETQETLNEGQMNYSFNGYDYIIDLESVVNTGDNSKSMHVVRVSRLVEGEEENRPIDCAVESSLPFVANSLRLTDVNETTDISFKFMVESTDGTGNIAYVTFNAESMDLTISLEK